MPLTRREFLKGMGLAIGGFGISVAGYEHLVPFIEQPEDIIPGVSTWYATSCRECPAGCGMVLRNREAHVVKCEGNSQHPINRGRLCARGQAALHGLYDPDRLTGPKRRDGGGREEVSWDDALDSVGSLMTTRPRVAIITDLQAGSLDTLMRQWAAAMGNARYIVYEPIDYEAVKAASGGVVPWFNIAQSDYLISFAADFLETWISPVEYAVDFAEMRRVRNEKRGRFVYVGPRVSMTAANADIRIIVPPGAEAEIARAIASEAGGGVQNEAIYRRYDVDRRVVRDVARGWAAAGAPLALPGMNEETARAAMALNGASGLVDRSRPHALSRVSVAGAMNELISSMEAGDIDVLIVAGANPVYSLPESARFIQASERVPNVISLSSFLDETATHAKWILPSNTPLESWGDYTPYPDVRNLMQPTMGTLFNTRHTGDILMELARRAGLDPAATFGATNFGDYLRNAWQAGGAGEAASRRWESLLQIGGSWPAQEAQRGLATPATGYETGPQAGYFAVPPTAAGASTAPTAAVATPPAGATGAAAGRGPAPSPQPPEKGELWLWPFPHIYFYDGRNANRRWLQEMPEPVTNCVWGTWAELHTETAERLGIVTDDLIEITHMGRSIVAPAYVWPGAAKDTVAVPMGEGHTAYGRYASGRGANVLKLAGSDVVPVRVSNTGTRKWAARIKSTPHQYGRAIAQTTALGKVSEREEKIRMPLPSGYDYDDFYPGHDHIGYRWAMVVDMNRCIGCNACVTACYAENNLGVVGEDGIRRRREMAWLRIDRYIDWKHESAPILFQPMLCQHCDAAPCEPVCPVYAAYHTEDGINAQIYNRCVGTRYCSNNCPYKVRRFNWFDYDWPSPLNYQLNPDVTVRSRGVMEKCTFCIQRVREARIVARREGRRIADGEVTPACVQTCPTGVYTFGDLKDPNSRVSRIIRTDPRAYQVLGHLNTKTAVIYLKRVVGS